MAAFFRKNNKTTIAELEEYYANQKSSKNSAKAWLMALLSLLITIAVILGLFFAGRFLYRTLTNDGTETTVSNVDDGVTLPSYDGNIAGSVATNTGSIDNINGNSSSTQEGTVSDVAASTDSNTTDSATSSSDESSTEVERNNNGNVAVLNTGVSSDSELPNTGASEIVLIATPILVALLGYSVSRKNQLR